MVCGRYSGECEAVVKYSQPSAGFYVFEFRRHFREGALLGDTGFGKASNR